MFNFKTMALVGMYYASLLYLSACSGSLDSAKLASGGKQDPAALKNTSELFHKFARGHKLNDPIMDESMQLSGQAALREEIKAEVLELVANSPGEFGHLPIENFRLDYIQITENPAMAYVRLVQTADDLEIEGSQVVVTLSLARPHLVMNVAKDIFPNITRAPQAVKPKGHGKEKFSKHLAISANQVREGEDAKIKMFRGKWRTVEEYTDPKSGVQGAVDSDGEMMVWDDSRYSVCTIQVTGRVNRSGPFSLTNTQLMPLSNLNFRIWNDYTQVGFNSRTDADGRFSVDVDPMAVLAMRFSIRAKTTVSPNDPPKGLYVIVNDPSAEYLNGDFGGHGYDFLAGGFIPGQLNPINWRTPVEPTIAEMNAVYHVNRVHDWLVKKGTASLPLIEARTDGAPKVGKTDCDGPYYSPTGYLNFNKSAPGCINGAYDSLIYHEYGHYLDNYYGGMTNPGLSEAWGDILASFLSESSAIGTGFDGPGTKLRDVADVVIYDPYADSYRQGLSFAGFAWELRVRMGVSRAETLLIPLVSSNSKDIRTAVKDAFLRLATMAPTCNEVTIFRQAAYQRGIDLYLTSDILSRGPSCGPYTPPPAETTPQVPTNVIAVAISNSQINTTWQESTPNVPEYVIRYGTSTNMNNSSVMLTYTKNLNLAGLAYGTIYYFWVNARKTAGSNSNMSGYSAMASVQTPGIPGLPVVPVNLVTTVISGTQIDLSWTEYSSGIPQYVIQYSEDQSFGTYQTILSSTTRVSITGLRQGGPAYYFRVAARSTANSNLNMSAYSKWARDWTY